MDDVTEPIVDEFNGWLAGLFKSEGSDLHVKVGSPPMYRMPDGLLRLDREPLTFEETNAIADAIVPASRRDRLEEHGETDFAYSVQDVGRFRTNVFHQRGSTSMVLRRLSFGGPTFAEVGLPDAVRQLAEEHRGLILVTGPTGSRQDHDALRDDRAHQRDEAGPHRDGRRPGRGPVPGQGRVDQSARGGHRHRRLPGALRAALRQDPDVILIGEMRDTETVRAAIQAAETGHLVMSTLHTVDATETVNRVIDFFPPHQQKQVRLALAGTLRGIICQRLVPTVDGGRIPALEIMVNTGRVAERIADPDLTAEIKDVIADGAFYGMITFDQYLLNLVRDGKVTIESAMKNVSSQHDFMLALQQAGMSVTVESLSPSHSA